MTFDDWLMAAVGALLLLAVAALVGSFWWDIWGWPNYARENNCHPTDQVRTRQTMIFVGKVPVPHTITEQAWVCDGGEIIWRHK